MTMTMKQFMNAVITAGISDEMTAFATAEIAKIDGKNEKRRTTQTATQKANAEMVQTIASEMTGTVTASEIATKYSITTQKASAIMQIGVKSGVFTVTDIKVKGKGKMKGYTVAVSADDSADSDPADDEVQALDRELAV